MRAPALEALAEVFELELEELPADGVHGLWPQPVHAQLAADLTAALHSLFLKSLKCHRNELPPNRDFVSSRARHNRLCF